MLLSAFLAAVHAVAGPLDHWTYRTNGVSPSAYLQSVTHGGGRFVAVGSGNSSGLILSSDDGITWSQRLAGTTSSFNAVGYGDGKFVAAGNAGVLAVSTNGIDWSSLSVSNTPYLYLQGITHGEGRFVIVGYQYLTNAPYEYRATICTSTDAVEWSHWTSSTNSRLNAVAYGNGRFVAVGGGFSTDPSSAVLTSEDGQSWSPHGSGHYRTLGVAFGGGLFVATVGGPAMLTSPDGATWTQHPVALANAYLAGVAYGNGTFLAVGSVNQSRHTLLKSTDGTNWQAQLIGPNIGNYFLYGAAFGGGTFLVVGTPRAIAQSGNVAQPSFESIHIAASGDVLLDLGGEVGRAYRLQASTDFEFWEDILSYTNDAPVTRVMDASELRTPSRFYRSVSH